MKKIRLILALALAFISAGAGTLNAAAAGGAAAASGISQDSKGRMYLADSNYHVLRRRADDGKYTILAGQEGVSGYIDGNAEKALFHSPWDVAAYKSGWAVSDTENHVIRYYNGSKVTTLAGTGTAGLKNGAKKKARFNRPTGLAVGKHGELYVADTGNHRICKIADGKVATFAGGTKGCADGKASKAKFNEPTGLYYDSGDGVLYVADSGNHRICRISYGKVTTVAGSSKGIEGNSDGKALKARFSNPQDIAVYKGSLYITDTGNGAVKKLSGGKVKTVAAAFSLNDKTAPAEPRGLTVKSGYLFVGDMFTEELLKIKL